MQPSHQSGALLSLYNTCRDTPERERQADTPTAQSLGSTHAPAVSSGDAKNSVWSIFPFLRKFSCICIDKA